MQHIQRTLSVIYSLYFLAVHSPSLHHTSTFTFYSLYISFLAVHSASHFYIHLP